MHWLSEHRVDHLSSNRSRLPSKISTGPNIVVPVQPEISQILRDNLSLPLPLLLVFLDPFISMSQPILLTGFLVNDFLKSCSASKPTLKVLMATSSKSPSISLNIFQYLSEYVFRVSPSRMVIDNREFKGWGTLLHVIKQDSNAQVSSLKELIEPAPRPSNHLITTGPKMDGNTLHIKALFLEYTAILWLKWLTCSTRSVRPLYLVNVG